MGLSTDSIFITALRASQELTQAVGGRIYGTAIPLPDEDADNVPPPYLIVTFDGEIIKYISTSGNVPTLVFTKDGNIIKPDSMTGEVQTLTTGETIKIWQVQLPASEAGEFTYTINYGNTTADITVTVG